MCMELSDTDVHDFAKIWNDEFHEKITQDEARLSASMLMDLYLLLSVSDVQEDETS